MRTKDPDGAVYNSTDFRYGYFRFLLPNPVRGGNYTCRVPSESLQDFCLEESELEQEAEETVYVDRMASRLALLEKENAQLRENAAGLARDNAVLRNATDASLAQLQRENARLSSEYSALRNATETGIAQQQAVSVQLSQRLQALENVVNRHVYFHATGLASYHPPYNTPLLVSDVLVNVGGGYNSSSGYFTAPLSGVYFFVATTGTYYGSNSYVQFDLFVDSDIKVDEIRAYTDSEHTDSFASVHGVVHLQPGQRVWVRSHGEEYYGQYTAFTGLLLSADP